MPTLYVNKKDCQKKDWCVVDAQDQVLGRLASRISRILTGKNRTDYTPNAQTGSGVIVINASGVRVSGNKAEDKKYKFYSGYPGGQREVSFENMMVKDSTYAIKHAVKGMLPKSRLGYRMMSRLLVYAGKEHPHKAQSPKVTKCDKIMKNKEK